MKLKPECNAIKNGRDVVYGIFNDFEIKFLLVQTAKYYRSLHTTHKNGITFAELYEHLIEFFNLIMEHQCYYLYGFYPPSSEGMSCGEYHIYLVRRLYDELGNGSGWIRSIKIDHEFGPLIDFTNFYQRELSIDERLPLSSDKFNEESIPFEIPMGIINFEPRMDWVPDEIISNLGYDYESIHDGSFSVFLLNNKVELLQAFKEAGYSCIHDEKLIAQAYGQ